MTDGGRRSEAGWLAALLAITVLRMGWLVPGQTLLWTEDQVGLWLPLYAAVREAFIHGHLPLWNPWVFGGLPLQENVQAAPFYLWHWLFFGMDDVVRAQELILTLAELMTAVFAWGWARRTGLSPAAAFVMAGAFTWSGVMSRQTTTLPHLECVLWLPFCLWMWTWAEQRRAALLGVVAGFAMMLLSGSIQGPMIVALGWCVLALDSWRSLYRTLACAALAAGLTAFFWWPAAHLLTANVRTLLGHSGFASSEAFGWSYVPRIFFPFLGSEGFWYVGTSATLLAVLARPRIRYWVLVVAAILVGLGDQGGLLPLAVHVFPPAELVRTTGRFTVLAALALAMLAGLAVDEWRLRRPQWRVAAVAALLVVVDLGVGARPATTGAEAVQVPPPLAALQGPGLYRFGLVFPYQSVHYLNWGVFIHRGNLAGFDAACTWPYLEALWYVDNDGPVSRTWISLLSHHDNMVTLHHWDSPIVRMLNTRYHLTFHGWATVPSPLPRFWVVHRTRVVSDHAALYAALLEPAFALQKEAMVLAGPPLDSGGRYGAVDVARDDAYGSRLTVTTDRPGLLVASQTYYPGEAATVDGRPVAVQTVDGILTAVAVPSGRHEVTLRYAPDLRMPVAVSCASVMVLCGWALFELRTR